MSILGTQQISFVDLDRQHRVIETELGTAFRRVLENGGFTLGTEVDSFEAEFAAYTGCSHAIGVGSGTDALHFALRACGVGEGDEVITAANTFAATAEAIVMCGARPVFVDVEEDTLLMDLDALEAAITGSTRAIIPVHLYGQCVDMTRVLEIARRHGLKVIEDACQAHGASRDGIRAGTAGDAGCFSFYPSKNLGALGDGGIVTTNDPHIDARIRSLRNHGEDARRLHAEVGYCSRLHGMQAALLRAKLPMLDAWNASRIESAAAYRAELAGLPVTLPVEAPGSHHVYHLFVVRTPDRDRMRAALADRGVQTGIHYAVPLHLEPAFAELGYREGQLPVAEAAAAGIMSLPMFPYLAADEVRHVARSIREAGDE